MDYVFHYCLIHKPLPEFTPHPAMYFVYILKDKLSGKLYYGYTCDIERRTSEHTKKESWELVYFEAYKNEKDARARERRLKHYAQALTALKGRLRHSLN